MRPFALLGSLLLAGPAALPGQWEPQPSGTTTEFRGLHAVNDRTVWAAGRGGVVARTTNGGKSWSADSIPGAANLFLIAVRALDKRTAWVLGTAFTGPSLARIYRTDDGGRSWRLQYENATPGIFFDGMAFWNGRHGIAFADPLEGRFFLITTRNGGNTWTRIDPERLPRPLAGEAAFAASGTSIVLRGKSHVWIGTGGGSRARVLHSPNRGANWEVFETPASGGRAKGIFGISLDDQQHGVAVGGDYEQAGESLENLLRTSDGGRTWRAHSSPGLTGVQYGVTGAGTRILIAVGPGGSSVTTDGGETWRRLEGPGFNTVSCAGRTCWAAGVEGRIARLRPVR
jgi:photosystem II stability/assembly factor-like uncharacterized protein